MVKDAVSARYAEALFDVARQEGKLDAVVEQLQAIAGLIRDHDDLRKLLLNPGVESTDKIRVLDRLLGSSWSADVRAFVQVVIDMDRASYLVEMSGALGDLADVERRVLRVTVRTAYPLAVPLRQRLTQWLEQQERASVVLTEEVDALLIGGIQVVMGHRVFDGSLRTQLSALRQRLKRVRVH